MANLATKKILIVDDESAICELFRLIFEVQDCDVRTAESVDLALNVLKDFEADLIVTDFKMPGKSGLDLIQHVRGQRMDTPIILTTGFTDISFGDFFSAGVDEILIKPINRNALSNAASNLCKPRNMDFDRDLPCAPQHQIDHHVEDIIDSADTVSWGKYGLFLQTSISDLSKDNFAKINFISEKSNFKTSISGKIRFINHIGSMGFGLQVYSIEGYKSEEIKTRMRVQKDHISIPNKVG